MDKNKSQKTSISSLSLRNPADGADKERGKGQGERYLNGKSERGVALVVVLVLSAVALALITALLYMITVGQQASGMQKRYRTALEAGIAGTDIITQVIAQRSTTDAGANTAVNTFLTGLTGLNASGNIPASCSGTAFSSGTSVTFTGLAAKIMTSSTTWNNNCGSTSLDVDPTAYDFMFQVGTNPQFNVYAKIVDAVEGNSSNSSGGKTNRLILNAVVGSSGGDGGEITTPSKPYLYTIEVDAENTLSGERAKLSVLYQY